MTVRSITGYGPIMEGGKTKVKTLTREREKAAAEVRKQESGLAAAKAVLEAKVINQCVLSIDKELYKWV